MDESKNRLETENQMNIKMTKTELDGMEKETENGEINVLTTVEEKSAPLCEIEQWSTFTKDF